MSTAKNLRYSVEILDSAVEDEKGYEMTWGSTSFYLGKEYGVTPKVWSVIEIYGRWGHRVQGICVDGITAFFRGEIELERDRDSYAKHN